MKGMREFCDHKKSAWEAELFKKDINTYFV